MEVECRGCSRYYCRLFFFNLLIINSGEWSYGARKGSGAFGREIYKPGVSITIDEVRMAVYSMHAEKSPGIDGLNPAFFQSYCKIVGLDVRKFCQQFLKTGVLIGGGGELIVP